MAQVIYQYRGTFYSTLNSAIDKAIDSYAKYGRYREQIVNITQKVIPINANCSQIQLIFKASNGKRYTRTINAIYVWIGRRDNKNLLSDYQASLDDEKRRESKK
jgi:hypothetical protein